MPSIRILQLIQLLQIIAQLIIQIPRTQNSRPSGHRINDPSASAGLEILIRNDNNKVGGMVVCTVGLASPTISITKTLNQAPKMPRPDLLAGHAGSKASLRLRLGLSFSLFVCGAMQFSPFITHLFVFLLFNFFLTLAGVVKWEYQFCTMLCCLEYTYIPCFRCLSERK